VASRRDGEELVINLKDNGQGFDLHTIEAGSGFGLIGMQERARQCRGSLSIESSPGDGTKLQLKVPIFE